MASRTTRATRTDARRNHDELLAAGARLFTERGADAPMEAVAQAVGVGQGTLYRHFPTRDHLFAEILSDRAEHLRKSALEAMSSANIGVALIEWLRTYDRFATDIPGLGTRVAHALGDQASPVGSTCAPMKEAFARLLRKAQDATAARRDVEPEQLLALIAAAPKSQITRRTPTSTLELILDGLSVVPNDLP
jgi:AcrR family transcriptional regulator